MSEPRTMTIGRRAGSRSRIYHVLDRRGRAPCGRRGPWTDVQVRDRRGWIAAPWPRVCHSCRRRTDDVAAS